MHVHRPGNLRMLPDKPSCSSHDQALLLTSIRDLVIVGVFLYEMNRGFTKCSRDGSRCCRVLRKARGRCEPSNHAAESYVSHSVCQVTASTASHKQPAEAGAGGRCACTELILRLEHSSHKPRVLGAITTRVWAIRQEVYLCKYYMQNRH